MVDDVYKKKLGVTRIGEVFEINGHRARVVGFTHEFVLLRPSPCVFTSFRNALDYVPLDGNQTTYLLVKTDPGPMWTNVRANILARVEGVDVLTSGEFSRTYATLLDVDHRRGNRDSAGARCWD